jgi:hypothetical protein
VAQGKENRIADKMVEEFLNPRFSHTIFAEHLRNLPPGEQQKVMDVLVSAFELMAQDYVLGHFDNRNRNAAMLAYEFDKVAKSLGE